MTTDVAVVLSSVVTALFTASVGYLRYKLVQKKLVLGHEDTVLTRLEHENRRLEKRLLALELERDLEERRAVIYRRLLYASGIEVPDVT